MTFAQVTIVGTGLIGGSLGLALKAHGLAGRIVGCDRAEVLEKARAVGAIDAGKPELGEACAASDLIVLAMPVGAIIDCLPRLEHSTALVTDVGSTKREIVKAAKRVWADAAPDHFLPGHPMAGRAEGGIENANPELFKSAAWLFTPLSGHRPDGKAGSFIDAVQRLGAKPLICDADEHDRLCAYVSHLPQMLATALANVVDELKPQTDGPQPQHLAGAGLRHMTRLAASPYAMWRDIALTNADNLADALLQMEQRLAHIRENLKSPELRAEFEKAQAARTVLK